MPRSPAPLENSKLRLPELRDAGQLELLELLDRIPGRKCLVTEPQLVGLLDLVFFQGTRLLREHGVTEFRELRGELGEFFNSDGQLNEPDFIIYLVRPQIPLMQMIARHIKGRKESSRNHTAHIHIYFIPKLSLICQKVLEDHGVLQDVELGSFNLGLVPFDVDILSLELENALKSSLIDGDLSTVQAISQSLRQIEAICGPIPRMKSKGELSKMVIERLRILNSSDPLDEELRDQPSTIDTLVLLDRSVDFVTPLLTPLTYEGLIDDIFGIRNAGVKLSSDLIDTGNDEDEKKGENEKKSSSSSSNSSRKISVPLNSSDVLFDETRDISIEALGTYLQEKVQEIKEQFSKFRDNKRPSTGELHDFVKGIPELKKKYKSLNTHINIAEQIKSTTDSTAFRERWHQERGLLEGETLYDEIEDLIAIEEPPMQLLRLFCLQSLTSDGFRSSKFDFFRREIVQTYGYEFLFTLANLEKLGLLRRTEGMSSLFTSGGKWAALKRGFRLINDSIDPSRPDDISYVSAGYAPLSVRLIQAIGKNGWGNITDLMQLLPGPTTECNSNNVLQGTTQANQKKVMLVYFVGGISYMEIAALRFLSRQPDFPYEIIIATTKILNGNTFLRSLVQDLI